MSLGESIRNLRKQNNLSQEQLAEKLGVSRQSVSLWEKNATQPTIDSIITLSDIFGVTVDELLKSDTPVKTETTDELCAANNSDVIINEKLFSKRQVIIAILDIIVLAVGIYMIWFFRNGITDFFNVLDLHFYGSAVFFLEAIPAIFGVLSALWLLIVILAFAKKKSYKIIKTVIIMLAITLFIVGNVTGGLIDDAGEKEAQDTIPQGASYFDLKAFESIDTASEYEEQYVEGETDSEIPVNYSVTQEYLENNTYTNCVEFSDNTDKNSELSRYFLELEVKCNDCEFNYLSDKECSELGLTKCEYSANEEGKTLSLLIIKGNRVYYCGYNNIGEINEAVKEQIRRLK